MEAAELFTLKRQHILEQPSKWKNKTRWVDPAGFFVYFLIILTKSAANGYAA